MENSKEEKVVVYPIKLSRRQKRSNKLVAQYKDKLGLKGKKPNFKERDPNAVLNELDKRKLESTKIQKNRAEANIQKVKSVSKAKEEKAKAMRQVHKEQLDRDSQNAKVAKEKADEKYKIKAEQRKNFKDSSKRQKEIIRQERKQERKDQNALPSPNKKSSMFLKNGTKVQVNTNRKKPFFVEKDDEKIVREGQAPPSLSVGDIGVVMVGKGRVISVDFKDNGIWTIERKCVDIVE